MRQLLKYILLAAVLLLVRCVIFEVEEEEEIPRDTIGVLEIEFIYPGFNLPEDKLHQLDLSIGLSMDSVLRGLFVEKANVSDHKKIYQFILREGEYIYRASIACSCLGDTCLVEGFPPGPYPRKDDYEEVIVTGGKPRRYTTSFE
jgi:hypothetical protein